MRGVTIGTLSQATFESTISFTLLTDHSRFLKSSQLSIKVFVAMTYQSPDRSLLTIRMRSWTST